MNNLLKIALLASLTPLLQSCAHMSQSIESADGDKYSSSGVALFSKQSVEAHGNLIVYPNASGLEFTAGSNGAQDSEAAIALLQSLLTLSQALSTSGASGLSTPLTPSLLSPLNPLASPSPTIREQIREEILKALKENLKPSISKDK